MKKEQKQLKDISIRSSDEGGAEAKPFTLTLNVSRKVHVDR